MKKHLDSDNDCQRDSFRPFGVLVAKWNARDVIAAQRSGHALESISHRAELYVERLAKTLGIDSLESSPETIGLACRKLNDPDPEVREVAIEYVGQLCPGTRDMVVLRGLAEIVADHRQSIRCRRKAYISIRLVMRLNIFRHGVPSELAIPEQIDWTLISACLKQESFVVQDDDDLSIEDRINKMTSPELRRSLDEFQCALMAFFDGNDSETIRHATECLAARPNAIGARYLRGCANANLGNLADAIVDLTDVIEATGDEPIFFLERGEMYRRRGLFDQAQSDENTATELQQEMQKGTGPNGT